MQHASSDVVQVDIWGNKLPEESSTSEAAFISTDSTPSFNPSTDEFTYYIGSAPDVDLNSPDLHKKIFYHPEQFLQGHVQYVAKLAAEKSSAMRLSGIGFKSIVIDPVSQRVIPAVSLRTLLSAGRIPLPYKDMKVAPVSAEEVASLIATSKETYSLEGILWQLALCASRGRLPANTPLDAPISLRHWPNLTRLQVSPHAARILSVCSRGSHSIREATESLDVPQRYIFALYSACNAIGLIQIGRKQTQATTEENNPATQAKNQQKRGIFRMLLNKLSGY